jgi:hypothetical protein
VGFLFVDDTDLMTVARSSFETPVQVTSQMQAAVDAWHGGLRASDSASKPDKCCWCLVSFYWVEGQWFYTSPASLPGTLTISVPTGVPVTIVRHDPSDAIKVMSIMEALDGNMCAQVETLQNKAGRTMGQTDSYHAILLAGLSTQ